MPNVKTDDPEIPSTVAKSTPAAHHSIIATPKTIRHNHRTKSRTIAAGPTKDSTWSRTS